MKLFPPNRAPVRREETSGYLLILLVSFAASVTLIRLFLQLTGYPQIGSGNLHIAHVLWGGLLLLAAALLPLLLANRWALPASAALAGVGTGLFIDEVGKFITSTNDYFYPAAAPIVYVFFLLTVWIYLQFRKPPRPSPRASFYRVLDILAEVLDRDLDASERAELAARLRSIAGESGDADLVRLAEELLWFVESGNPTVVPARPGLAARARAGLRRWEERELTRGRMRIALAGGLAALGVWQAAGLTRLTLALRVPAKLDSIMRQWVLDSHVSSPAALNWFVARLGLELAVGAVLAAAAVLFILRREKPAASLAVIGLLLSLAGTNLLVFYFEQFSTILPAAIELAWLLLTLRHRERFLSPRAVAS